jgi:MYXO-CTERM domain-containing protein
MQPIDRSNPRRRHSRFILVAVLLAVGCSSSGGGCGGSCGGAFKTKDAQGHPIVFTGSKLDNVAQVRVTRAGFDFLNASHLNDLIGDLNAGTSGGLSLPCVDAGTLLNACIGSTGFHFSLVAGDTNFNGVCDAGESTPLHMSFKDVKWTLLPSTASTAGTLRAHIISHVKTGDIYIRTKEAHSSLCSGNTPIQARVKYDDELPGLPQQDTSIDLDIQFSTAPDGRLEFNFSDASLGTLVTNFQPAALVIDNIAGTDPVPNATGVATGDGCGSGGGNYSTTDGAGSLSCGGLFGAINANCNVDQSNPGGLCAIVQYVRGYLFDFIKNRFKDQIVGVIRQQIDKRRCQRAADLTGAAQNCNTTNFLCPNDDNGHALDCDTSRGVCVQHGQSPQDPPSHECEPLQLGVAGEIDVSDLTQKVGFPPNTKLDLFAGLGSKTASPQVDANGVQFSAMAGTQPASNYIGLCVKPAAAADFPPPPAMNFDDTSIQPTGVAGYALGFSLASSLLNRGFLDAYNAGLLCVAITNKTTAFISSGLFSTFLPSLGKVTGDKDVPMVILLRPTQPPYVRIGQNSTTVNSDGTLSAGDPLITLSLKQMNLDFYALVDERQVRIFTLQADMLLPLGLRTFADPNADTLQPVLGSLDTVLTNISALSPKGTPYGATDMLAEDPGVVKDLFGAAIRLAQPLLAGVLKPIKLPSFLGLQVGVTGLAGAIPLQNVTTDGYAHLALWASMKDCSAGCEQITVKAGVKVLSSVVPDDVEEIRQGQYPSIELEGNATLAHPGSRAEYSYRVDGSLWSPWLSGPKFSIRDPLFLVQGHHTIEVTAREQGDDHTMDPQPVAVDFFVSYQAPKVSLVQRADGAVATRASSAASGGALRYSYRIDGDRLWTQPGEARVWSLAELGGLGLSVSVSDEAGRSTQAHFGPDEELAVQVQAGRTGCSTSPGAPAWSLLPLLGVALLWRRRQNGSSSRG